MNGRRIGCRCHWRFLETVLSPSRAVKDAKAKHMSNIINSNSHCPGILFSIINSVINPMSVALNDVSEPACDAFRQYFVDKVSSVRQSITQAPTDVTSFPAV